MEENDTKDFKISFNEDELGPPPLMEVDRTFSSDSSEKKIQQQIAIASIAISVFFLVILIFLYHHMNTKIIALQNAGTSKVDSLTQTIELKLHELTNQTDKLQVRIQKEIDNLDVKIKSVSGSLGKNQNSLDKSVSEKAGKDDLKKTADSIDKKIADINSTIQKISSDLNAVDTEVNNQLKKQLGSVSKKMDSLSQDTATLAEEFRELSQNRVDQKKLEFELDLQAKRYKTELKQVIDGLENKLAEIRKKEEASRRATILPGKQVIAPTPTLSIPVPARPGEKRTNGILEKELLE